MSNSNGNKKSIRILRGSPTYDVKTSEEVLLDGQPFYSKKTKQLYIGDGTSKIKELKGTQLGLNICNGEGVDSLIQTYLGDVDDTHYESVCTGESSISLGEANNVSGKRSAAFGKLNNIQSANAFSAGLQNTLGKNATNTISGGNGNNIGDTTSGSGRSSIVSGLNNTIIGSGQQSLVIGEGNIVRALNSKVSGKTNKVFGNSVIVSGQKNEVVGPGELDSFGKLTIGSVEDTKATSNIIVGESNSVKAKSSAVFGSGNALNLGNDKYGNSFIAGANNYSQADRTFLLGNGLEVRSYLQTAIGTYNKYDTDALFVVGNGTGSAYSNRKNAFEVNRLGGFKAFGNSNIKGTLTIEEAPVTDTDAIRLKELNSTSSEIKTYTDTQINETKDYIDSTTKDIVNNVNSKLNNKLSVSGDQILTGSLTTTGDLTIQGSLNVTGEVNTVNQETLTVKDNLIAINGDGSSLDSVGIVGVVAITGEQLYTLKNDTYELDASELIELSEPYTVYDEYVPWGQALGCYKIYCGNDVLGNLNLFGVFTEFENEGILCVSNGGDYHPYLQLQPGSMDFATFDSNGNIVPHSSGIKLEFRLENQSIKQSQFDLMCQLFKHQDGTPLTALDFTLKGEAYAAPVYDKNDDTLKIGLGTYEKDENNNIKSFTFAGGQGQSIATRADTIDDDNLVKWDDKAHKLVDAGVSIKSLQDQIINSSNLNIKNGESAGSLISVSSNPTDWPNTATGVDTIAFGIDSHATNTRAVAIGNTCSSHGNTSFTIGQSNINYGNATFVSGGKNEVEQLYSLNPQQSGVFGQFNKVYNAWSLTAGKSNENHAYSSAVFGQENIVNENARFSLNSGNLNNNSGVASIVGGIQNNSTSAYSIITGSSNIITSGESSSVSGKQNNVTKVTCSVVSGIKNNVAGPFKKDSAGKVTTETNEGTCNIVVGNQNTVNTSHSAVFGNSNTVYNYDGNTSYCFVAGNNNKAKAARNILIGQGLESNKWRQVVLGSFNDPLENGILLVGCGESSSAKKNGLVVTWDGRVKAKGVPTEDDDVVRLKELKNLSKLIEGLTDAQITALNKFAQSLVVEEV